MDESIDTEKPGLAIESAAEAVEETSAQYLGRWNRLVSTTNWEKGQIICQWRADLIEAGSPPQAYSDEAWSRRVGNVSSQHVGRLRRVFERFADQYEQYPGLFWSHFQSASDWSDAEMWLEGAAQNGWSVSQMRSKRWETLGATPELRPRDEDIITAEFDEDMPDPSPVGRSIEETLAEVRNVADDEAPAPERSDHSSLGDTSVIDETFLSVEPTAAAEPVRPFENLLEKNLPDDLADAMEAMKLAILRHKLAGWAEIGRDDVLAVLDALKLLALSPAEV